MDIFIGCKNTKDQGNIGLGYAIRYFTSNHYTVSLPLNDSQDYDLIVECDDKILKKVQVKTSTQNRDNIFTINLRVLGGNSKKNFVHKKNSDLIYDLLFVVCNNGDMYLIPKESIKGNSTIKVGKSYSQFLIEGV